jgi:ATP-dependent RNA helicase RhlE
VNYDFPMHAEDYVHRIGRTGRAQAIGDALSFVTSEDQSALRSLERFIGRGLLRKKAEDFDYSAQPSAAAQPEAREREQKPRVLHNYNRRRGPSSSGGGGDRGGRSSGGSGGGRSRDGGGQRSRSR